MPESPNIDTYIQAIFETYDDWMSIATLHLILLDDLKADGVSFGYLPSIEQILQHIRTLIETNRLEWKNLSTHGGMCLMVRPMRR